MNTFLFLRHNCDLAEQNSEIKLDPEAYQQWLDKLPHTKTQLTAEQLLRSMIQFNRIEMDAGIRQKLLLQYLKKVQSISPSLELELDRPEGLGHEVARRAVSVIVSLYATLFEGLRITSAQRIIKPPLLNRDQSRIELISRTLQAAREVMVTAGRYHVDTPKNIWLHCHSIYTYIQSENLLEKSYKSGVSLGDLYTQILLIGMLPQSRINGDAFDWLYQKVTSLVSHVRISKLEDAATRGKGFYFDVSVDFPPKFFSRSPSTNLQNWRQIDCQAIIDAFDQEVDALDNQGKSFSDEVVLMRLILIEWCYSVHRRQNRLKVQEPIWVQTRMSPVWELLSQDNWNPGDILSGGRFAVHPSLMNKIDENEYGYGVSGDPQGMSLQIGELALTKAGSNPQWSLGVVRWLMVHDNDLTINCGIEFVSFEAVAVEVRPLLGAGNTFFTPALQLPANPKQGKGCTLVLTGRMFSRLREVILKDSDGNEISVRLSRLTLQTSFYQFVEFLLSEDL